MFTPDVDGCDDDEYTPVPVVVADPAPRRSMSSIAVFKIAVAQLI